MVEPRPPSTLRCSTLRLFALVCILLAVLTSCGEPDSGEPEAGQAAALVEASSSELDLQPVDQQDARQASTADSVWLADLTWPEVSNRVANGSTTVIVPTGGTEQNGPHMALDKHNVVVRHTAEQIAARAGNVLVAPVMGYVPEGDLGVRDGHLRWPGTISVPPNIYSQVLEATADSLAGHGFTLVVLLGDSGSSQAAQAAVAADLTQRWASRGIRVVNLDAYYDPVGQRDIMYAAGIDDTTIGSHAGAIDTSELLALRPDLIRSDQAAQGQTPGSLDNLGVDGNGSVATAALGDQLLELKISAGLTQLRSLRGY